MNDNPHLNDLLDIAYRWESIKTLREQGHIIIVKADGLRPPESPGYTVLIDDLPRADGHDFLEATSKAIDALALKKGK